MGGLDPLRIDPAFWQRADVELALEQRDVGALFRLLRRHAGASQHRIGSAVDIQQGNVSAIMRGARGISSFDVMERIADGLDMPGDARMRFGLAPKEETMRRRTALGIGLVAAISPATLAEVLHESAAEALEFTRERATTSVGTGTLEHLAVVTSELERSYQSASPNELFSIARAYRQRVAQLIDGRHTLQEARELYVYAARLSYLLSDLSHDLNSWVTAKAYGIDGREHADQAGHHELYAWATLAAAAAPFYLGHPGESVRMALEGLRRVPDRHPVAIRLRCRAARGYARQGNHASCTELLGEARRMCDHVPDEVPSVFADTDARPEYTRYCLTASAATCYVLLADWTEAERHARDTLGVATLSPGRAAAARMDLAIALANLGSPDEAAEHGTQALAADRWLGSLLPRARQLHTVLTTRYPELTGSQALHDRYRQLTRRALTN
jgi:transcriptional regulator with XRE-family HTH domain